MTRSLPDAACIIPTLLLDSWPYNDVWMLAKRRSYLSNFLQYCLVCQQTYGWLALIRELQTLEVHTWKGSGSCVSCTYVSIEFVHYRVWYSIRKLLTLNMLLLKLRTSLHGETLISVCAAREPINGVQRPGLQWGPGGRAPSLRFFTISYVLIDVLNILFCWWHGWSSLKLICGTGLILVHLQNEFFGF